jgi:hypothetical protein
MESGKLPEIREAQTVASKSLIVEVCPRSAFLGGYYGQPHYRSRLAFPAHA